jgi:fimbrial chaperone protein
MGKVDGVGMRWIARLAACLMSASAVAATLQVSPVRITISADGKAGVVRLHNQSDVSTLVQVEALVWDETADLSQVPTTSEILAVPPVFEIAAGAEQLIRLALRKPLTSGTEQAYRLLITEVPRVVGDGSQGVSFALRLNLPVFVTPEGALPQPSWSLQRDGGGAKLTLGNQGNAHVRVQSIALFEDGGANPVFVSDEGGYVLAGRERSWQLDLASLKAGASLTVKAETNLGELEAPVDIRG